jgi:hypothetical protein
VKTDVAATLVAVKISANKVNATNPKKPPKTVNCFGGLRIFTSGIIIYKRQEGLAMVAYLNPVFGQFFILKY